MPDKPKTSNYLPPLIAILAMVLVDCVWASKVDLLFTGFQNVVITITVLASISVFYKISRRSHTLSAMAFYGILWIIFTVAAGILTYLAARTQIPMQDIAFNKIDKLMGFDWLAFYKFVQSRSTLEFILSTAYNSLLFQIVGSIIYFSHADRNHRYFEFFWLAFCTLCMTAIGSNFFPAAGTFSYFKIDEWRGIHLPHYMQLRGTALLTYPLQEMQGIITFPSYHAALAVIFIYIHRRQRIIFPLALMLNVLMLIATPVFGGHYLIDVIAGVSLAMVCIASHRYFLRIKKGKVLLPERTISLRN